MPSATSAAAEQWLAYGAGPFFVREHIEVHDVVYRGQSASFDHSSAYGQWGSIMVELVQDHGTGPSPVREMFPLGASGLHHLAFFVDDLDAATQALSAAGFGLTMSAVSAGGVRFHFIDTVDTLGHMIELYEATGRLRGFYRMVAEAAEGWDGSDPFR